MPLGAYHFKGPAGGRSAVEGRFAYAVIPRTTAVAAPSAPTDAGRPAETPRDPRPRRAGDGRLRRLRRRQRAARQVHPRRRAEQGAANSSSDGKQAFVWIGLHEPDEHQMQAVADVFGLHELAVEDAVHAHQRPKLERYDDTLFLVLKTITYVEHESVGQGPRDRRDRRDHDLRRTATSSSRSATATTAAWPGCASGWTPRRPTARSGPYAVMHAIADHVVDHYLEVTDLVENDIDAMEENVFSPSQHHRHRAHLPAQAGGRRDAPGGQPADAGAAAHRAPTTTT